MKIIAEDFLFPEGPVYTDDGDLLLVEIAGESLIGVTAAGVRRRVAHIPGGPNGAALYKTGDIYVCNNGGFKWRTERGGLVPDGIAPDNSGGRIEVVNPATGKVERLYQHCDGKALNAPNDLVFDGEDGFWFTDHGHRRGRQIDRGSVYWAKADGSKIREVVDALLMPNGIGLSPDGKTLYVAETATGRLWSWRIIAAGEVEKIPWPSPHGGRLVHGFADYCRLDGLAVAASGDVCLATLERGSIAEFCQSSGKVSHYDVADLMVTNLCFGGPDNKTAFVTMSHSGRLAKIKWKQAGLPLNQSPRLDVMN